MNDLTKVKNGAAVVLLTFCGVGFFASLATAADSRNSFDEPRVAVRVVRIYDSPGVWSGVVNSVQAVDAVVASTSAKTFILGERLHLGVTLLKGNPFCDPESPKLSSKKVYDGAVLSVRIGVGCLLPKRSQHYAIDPGCLRSAK